MNAALLVVAVCFAGMGLVAFVSRDDLAPFGVAPSTPAARSEVRGVYGGYGLAVAGLLVAAADASTGVREGVLVAVAVSVLGMAAGRLVSAALEPRTLLGWPGFFLVVELALGSLALLAR